MPLMLGGTETERNQTVVWDTLLPDEDRDAKAQIARLLNTGFVLSRVSDGEVVLAAPTKDAHQGVFRILTENGDDRLVWDRRSGPEVKDAYKTFNDLAAKGYTAYAVTASGQRGHKITEFDPALEEIIMVPSTMPG